MHVRATRVNGRIDCVQICPVTPAEEAELTQLIENRINIRKAMILALKETAIVDKKVERHTDDTNMRGQIVEVYSHN
jgi:hypothetical protein